MPLFFKQVLISKIHIPTSTSSQSIDCFYLNQADQFETSLITYPMLNQELVFNLGEWFEVKDIHDTYNTKHLSNWVSGLQTKPILTQAKGKHLSVGILFKPWGLYQTFGISPTELTNTAIDAQIIGNKLMEEFVKEETANTCLDNFLPAFENFMFKHFKPREIKQEVIETIHTIQSGQIQKGIMGKIAGELKISPKTFIHYFNQTVGVSPIQYLHLLQVNQAIQLITKHPAKSLTDIGLQAGFYDQSHFIKTFKSFCNLSPNTFRNNKRKQVNSVQFGLFTLPYFC